MNAEMFMSLDVFLSTKVSILLHMFFIKRRKMHAFYAMTLGFCFIASCAIVDAVHFCVVFRNFASDIVQHELYRYIEEEYFLNIEAPQYMDEAMLTLSLIRQKERDGDEDDDDAKTQREHAGATCEIVTTHTA